MTPAEFYTHRKNSLQTQLDIYLSRRRLLGVFRLLFFLAALIAGWLLLSYIWYIPLSAFCFLFGIFIFCVSKDLANSKRIAHTKRLISVNENELLALQHLYHSFYNGEKWKPAQHDYAHDLDIFGNASLFQFINRTKSENGHALFSSWLLQPPPVEMILKRQTAVKELAKKISWVQELQALGEAKTIEIKTKNRLSDWLRETVQFSSKPGWNLVRFIFPVVSFTWLGFHLAGIIAFSPFVTGILFMLVIAFGITKLIMPAYSKLNRMAAELDILSDSIRCIEEAEFEAAYLREIQSAYRSADLKASASVRGLRNILDRLDYRLNPVVFIPLSAFLCWDLWQVIALEKWKQKHRDHLPAWFDALAAFESIGSFATLSFNYPGWCFPGISEKEGHLETNALGHPLIPVDQRVNNDFGTTGTGKLNLITGSNMAGKSTFLRSAGVNIVLAMAGAPVCARSFSMSHMKVMSSMRVNDNLDENTSTFYAELKKLKSVLDAVNQKQKVFLLLDEILRGTNSADRHTGSAALIKQLIKHDAAGMLATHDLELAKLEEEFPGEIRNYHFDVQVSGEELYFDYKLKDGVCTSMNASLLMKKIGIRI